MGEQNQNNHQSDSNPQSLRQQLIVALNIANFSDDEQSRILSKAEDVVLKKILLKIMDTLSEEDKNQFDQLLKESSEDKALIETFLKEKIPNFKELSKKEIEDFKAEF